MSRQFGGATTKSGKTVSPEGYLLKHVLLQTTADVSDSTIDITNLVTEIVVNESLFSSSVETEITIQDAVNLLQDGKVTGSERIDILIERTEPSGEYKSHTIVTYIASIESFARLQAGFETYVFKCISNHSYINQTKQVSRSFSGSISKLIKNLVEKDLDAEIAVYNSNTKGSIRGIYPNISPLECITWLLRNATENSTPFYFFESLKNGIELDSYESLVNQDVYREYNYLPNPDGGLLPGTQGYFEVLMGSIRKISSDLDISQFHMIGDGAYGSTVNTLDYATKSHTSKQVGYDDKAIKLNKHKPFSNSTLIGNKQIAAMSKAKEFNISLNSKGFRSDNYHSISNPSIARKQSYFTGLGFMTHDIIANGDFDMSPGKKIILSMDKVGDLFEGVPKRNEYMSGKYIVTEITHVFGSEYTMDMLIAKDSMEQNFDE
jgi:hypothetical protein